jgi:hypothetical protein
VSLSPSNPLLWYRPPVDAKRFEELDKEIREGRGDDVPQAPPLPKRPLNTGRPLRQALPGHQAQSVIQRIRVEADPPDKFMRRAQRKLPASVLALWAVRPCFVCSSRGACKHRELDLALAEIEGVTTLLEVA